jgi:Tol biopolymer transport system component
LLRRCLAKDPRQRLRDIGDAALELNEGGKPHNPFFSPDGTYVAFSDGISALSKVPVAGGATETICRITFPGIRASWGDDGTIVLSMAGSLWRVPSAGGTPEQIATPDQQSGENGYSNPDWLLNGRAFLFTIGFNDRQFGIGVFDLQSRTKTVLSRDGSLIRYLRSGHLLYRTGTSRRLIAFDPDKLQTSGIPATLSEPISTPTFSELPDLDVSDNGTLIYIRDDTQAGARQPVWVHRDGSEEQIGLPIRGYTYPSIAPDGKQAAFDIRDQENDTWICVNFFESGLYWKSADGSGAYEELLKSPRLKAPTSFSPDGTRLLFREDYPETGHDLMVISLDASRKMQPLLQTKFNELNADISPDGRWVAYESDESGSTFSFAVPAKLFDGRYYMATAQSLGRTYDVSPDGRRFLMIKPDVGPPASIMVVLNWFTELGK